MGYDALEREREKMYQERIALEAYMDDLSASLYALEGRGELDPLEEAQRDYLIHLLETLDEF